MAAPAQHSAEPERLYRIGDVSRLTDTKPFVLRFWETEFPMLQPVKTPKGHRLYRQQDIDLILAIKRLLYQEGFTIPGARRHLADQLAGGTAQTEVITSLELKMQSALFPSGSGDVTADCLRRSIPQLRDRAPTGDHADPAVGGAKAVHVAAAANIPPMATDQMETLRAVREELRAILTLLGTG